MNIKQYTHLEPGEENRAIAGYFEVEKEFIVPIGPREILCVQGYVCWDNTCCGSGGCRYVNVPGYLLDHKKDIDHQGRPVSRVERITDEKEQKQIRDLLRQRIGSLQIIDFW